MSMIVLTPDETVAEPRRAPRLPVLTLLHPRQYTRLVVVTGSIALLAVVVVRTQRHWELWQAVLLALAIMAVPAALKWRDDSHRYGLTAAVASALITLQGLHSTEHLVQWIQRHVLHQPLRESNGLLSPANIEWVHFIWNSLVWVTVVFLFSRGMRNVFGWAMLLWISAHTVEHTYLFVRFIQVRAELDALGFSDVTAQGLPGIVGRGGWLDLNAGPSLRLICGMPFVTTADRLDAHFAWNTGEILLALPAVHLLLRRRISAFG